MFATSLVIGLVAIGSMVRARVDVRENPAEILQHLLALEDQESQRPKTLSVAQQEQGLVVDNRPQILAAAYAEHVRPLLAESFLVGATQQELDQLFKAAQITAFYTFDRQHVADMARLLHLMSERGMDVGHHVSEMYKALVAVRLLDQAREFAVGHQLQEPESLPTLQLAQDYSAELPSVLAPQAGGRSLIRRNVDMGLGIHIVAVVHPFCHFSQAAMAAVLADREIFLLFKARTTWLVTPDGRIDYDVVQQWNLQHPQLEFSLTYSPAEWPGLDYWGTPTFYFFENGVIKRKVVGWPPSGGKAKLMKVAGEMGLLSFQEQVTP